MSRRENDFYPTPKALTNQMLTMLRIPKCSVVVECCSGQGDIAYALEEHGYDVITNDVDMSSTATHHFDATRQEFWDLVPEDATVVTNPPFHRAMEILNLAHGRCGRVVMLLRLSFLEPTRARKEFLETFPPDAVIVTPRASFTADGKKDCVTTAWMVWDCQSSVRGVHVLQDWSDRGSDFDFGPHCLAEGG